MALADPQNGLICLDKVMEEPELLEIPVPVDLPAAPVFLAEQGRVDVVPTGEDQAVVVPVVPLQYRRSGGPQGFQGCNKVGGTFRGAGDGDVFHGVPSFL